MSMSKNLKLTLVVNSEDDAGYRDTTTRELLQYVQNASEMVDVDLARADKEDQARSVDSIALVGHIMMELAPAYFEKLVDVIAEWIKQKGERQLVTMKIGDIEAQFPENTSAQSLKAWKAALLSEVENPEDKNNNVS